MLIVTGLMSLSSQSISAQDIQTVTLEEAIRIGLEQNTDMKRARSDVRLRGTYVSQERMDFLPNLQLSTNGTRTFGRSFSQAEGEILSETSNFVDLEASTSMNLFNGFEKAASLNAAQSEEQASAFRLERTRQDVVFQIIERFVSLLQNQQLAEVRRQEIEAQQDLLEQVEGLVKVGRRPKSDLYQQQASLAEAEVTLAEAERQVEVGKTMLIQVLQLNPRGNFDFEAPELTDSTATLASRTYDLDNLLETTFARRADLKALASDLRAARHGVQMAQSGYWPSLSLGFGYGSDWSSSARLPVSGTGSPPQTVTLTPNEGGEPVTFPVPGTGSAPLYQTPDFLRQLDSRRGGSFRLSLSVPVFNRLQTKASVEAAQVQVQNRRYDLQDQRQQAALQVRQSVLDYRAARTKLRAARQRQQAAQQARESARRRYELGAATFVELEQATSEYVSARSTLIQARYEVVLTKKLIDYYTGRLDPRSPLSP